MKPAPAVVLVGPRGAGKSTLAPLLAQALGYRVVDTDQLLAARTGMPAGDYLRQAGEPAFRAVEQEVVLAALQTAAGAVFALGGGAVLSPAVRARLSAPDCLVVFLIAPVPVLTARIQAGGGRPSLTGRPPAAEIGDVLAARLPLYRAVAGLEFDTAAHTPLQLVASLRAHLQRLARD